MGNERKHIINELEQENSELHRLLKDDTLRIPNGYLEALESRLMQIPQAKPRSAGIRNIRLWAYAAAAVVVLGLCIRVFVFRPEPKPLHIALAEMESDELDTYFHEQIAALSYDELYDYLTGSVQAFETNDLFETQFADTSTVTALLYDRIEEQVFTDAIDEEEPMLEEHMIETVGEEELDAFINSTLILDDLGL